MNKTIAEQSPPQTPGPDAVAAVLLPEDATTRRARRWIGLAVFLTAFFLLFATLDDPGVTLDEPYANREAAISFVTWLELALADVAHGNWEHLTSREFIKEYFKPQYLFHPPFARTLTGITWKWFHGSLGEIRALRLAPAVLFAISVALLFLLVARYYGWAPGIVASFGLLLCPAAFGHAHLIALDSQIASMWLITAFCFIHGLHSRRWAVLFAVSAGLAMNTKIHGFAAPLPLFFWGLLFFRKNILPNLVALLVISPLVLYLTNPSYWHSLYNLVDFLDNMMTKKSYEQVSTHFLGEHYGFSPPKYYAFFMTSITLPPLTLILSLFGLVMSAWREIRSYFSRRAADFLGLFFTLNALSALGLTLFKNIPIYDGVRLFLSAFPFLAGLAGIGSFYLARIAARQSIQSILAPGLAVAVIFFSGLSLARIHPFELSYFNLFVGGPQGARKLGLESTYWNDAFTLETAAMMNRKYHGKAFSEVTGLKYTFKYYKQIGILDPSISQKKTDYDYYLLQYRQGWFKARDWFYADYLTPEYAVRREGVPLLEIYKSMEAQGKDRPDLTNTKAGSKISPKGFEWFRYLVIPETGRYRFAIFTPHEHTFKIDEKPSRKLDFRNHHGLWEYAVQLTKGVHTLELFFPHTGKPVEFYPAWITPAGDKGLVPRKALIPAKTTATPAKGLVP
ncbi:MAG: ArnT family glycosyltransferase [Nitrospinales bacterium]